MQESIFPDLQTDALISQLVVHYKPTTVLTYNDARDELWKATAMRHKDTLTCVYSGFFIRLDLNKDPSTDAYNKGINCEHTWPQSKGAVGLAASDMHHIFPVKESVNSARGNLPFKEIPDNETDLWYKGKDYQTNMPTANIDLYSEKDNAGWFEPREQHKGNVARAMFYFYTMYEKEANQYDSTFFKKQKETLYLWHIADPVDEEEKWRNEFIASKQGGKLNPFILDTSLIRRAYFPNYSTFSMIKSNEMHQFESRQNYPNPFNQTTKIDFYLSSPDLVNITVFDSKGKIVRELLNEYVSEGQHTIEFDAFDLPNGIYYYLIKAGSYIQRMDMMLFK